MIDEKMLADFAQVRRMMNEDLDKLERNMIAGIDAGNAALADTERRLSAAEREVELLGKQVRIAQSRENELTEKSAEKDMRIARLESKLQGVKDQVVDLPENVPTTDQIEPRGKMHQEVFEEASALAVNLEAMEAEMTAPADPTERFRDKFRKIFTKDEPVMEPAPGFPEEPRRVEA